MIGVTLFGIFLTPVFYVLLRRLTGNRPLKMHGEVPHEFGGLSLAHVSHGPVDHPPAARPVPKREPEPVG
jgi:multidrug efflux pump